MRKIIFSLFTMLSLCPVKAQTSALEGQWQLVAASYDNIIDTIPFTATLTTDGQSLECHADNFYTRGSKPYPMDWYIAIEQEGETTRLGWVLTSAQPASPVEYGEPADGTHRYIYLLSENIDTQQLEGMTLWCDYSEEKTAYLLPKTQQLYGVVSQHIPFSGVVEYIDIWASGRIQKKNDDPAGISEIVEKETSDCSYFDLQGRRISGQPSKGIYIMNGRKYILK